MKKNACRLFVILVISITSMSQVLVAQPSENLRGRELATETPEDADWTNAVHVQESSAVVLFTGAMAAVACFFLPELNPRKWKDGVMIPGSLAAGGIGSAVISQVVNYATGAAALIDMNEDDETYRNSELSKVSPAKFKGAFWASVGGGSFLAALGITHGIMAYKKVDYAKNLSGWAILYATGATVLAIGDVGQWYAFFSRD